VAIYAGVLVIKGKKIEELKACVVDLTYLSLIRLWLKRAGVEFIADFAMQSMRNLSSCLCWQGDKKKPFRMIGEPTPDQAKIVKVFGSKKYKKGYYKPFDNNILLSNSFLENFTAKSESQDILCCIIALPYLRLIRLWLKRSGLQMSIDTAMGHMRRLRSCLCWHAGKKEPVRMIEDPTPEQEQILAVFGYKIEGGVSQRLKA